MKCIIEKHTVVTMAIIRCPACDTVHGIVIKWPGQENKAWGFNGDLNKPTFTPSYKLWYPEEYYKNNPNEPRYVCHSMITDGIIHYLDDCTHSMVNQSVELPDF